MKRDDHSVAGEPVFSDAGGFDLDPSEAKVTRQSGDVAEIDALRDSVLSEPSLGAGAAGRENFAGWLLERKSRVGLMSLVIVTLLAGLVGGSFAIFGALAKSGVSRTNFVVMISYVVVLGPLLEEMLKQSGAIFLLERRPYWLKHGWQLPVIALLGALVFATIENIMYINGPLKELSGDAYDAAVSFRWKYCTLLHVSCSLIASRGMWLVWQRQLVEGAPARLSVGYPWIVAAVVCHGVYNFTVTIWSVVTGD